MEEGFEEKNRLAERFCEDYSYYDVEEVELNNILAIADLTPDKTLVDIGAGVGRLSLPLSKKLRVTALEPNKFLLDKFQNKKIEKVNMKAEEYFPEEKFDFALLAWPQFDNWKDMFKHIRENILKESGKLIVVKSKQHSLKELASDLFPEKFVDNIDFLAVLSNYFKITVQEIVETKHVYPDFDKAVELFKFEMEEFYGNKIGENQENLLADFLKKHTENGKFVMSAQMRVIFCEPKL